MLRMLSITHIRVLVLVLNLVLAGALVFKALAAYEITALFFDSSESDDKVGPDLVPLERFREDGRRSVRSGSGASANRVSVVSDWLNPRKPSLGSSGIDEGEMGEGADEGETSDEPVYAGGPLEEKGWQYYSYMLRPDSPEKSLIILRKKEETASTRPTRRTFSNRGRPPRPRPNTRAGRRGGTRGGRGRTNRGGSPERISFTVGERWIRLSEDDDFEFKVHSADEERLVYWTDNSKEMYALSLEKADGYTKEQTLGPLKKEDEETDEEDGEEKKEKFFITVSVGTEVDFEEARKQDYEALLRGSNPENLKALRPVLKKPAAKATRRRGGSTRNTTRRSTATPSSRNRTTPAAKKSSKTPSGTNAAGGRPEAKASTPQKPSQEDVEQFRNAVKDLPPDAQKQLREGLTGQQ